MKPILKLAFSYFLLSASFLSGQTPVNPDKSVKIWEETLIMPTYQVDTKSTNPRFYDGRSYQGAQGRIYPYPVNESLSSIRIDQQHNMVYLENEFIKINISPEFGGRLWGALDKSNQYDFIYRQHVVKPALVGMLGAWLEGGIEWNFPHHHRANTYMPVDYDIQKNPDGSATLWIGELELRDRMKFMLGISVYPDKSYFEVTFRPINSTPFANSFLYFANTSVHTNDDYQVQFPPSTVFGTYHAKNEFLKWPISHEIFNGIDYTQGVDVSWWKNHEEWTSIFAYNYTDDFIGAYDHGKEAGTVIVSNHNIAPGKKFWTWSNGPRGKLWDNALTDTDGPALELMVGGYSDNQPDYSWLQPYESKYLKQYWYPIRGIGGVKNANIEAAVNLEFPSNEKMKIGFVSTSSRKDAKVVIEINAKKYFEQSIDIDPSSPFVKEMSLPANTKETDVKVVLLSSDGKEIISYQPVEKKDLPFPATTEVPKLPKEIGTIEDLYQTGLRISQFRNATLTPYPYYEEALKRDQGDYRVNTALGLLYLRRGMFNKAEELLQTAVDRITKNYTKPRDGEAYYYLGVCQRFMGKDTEAYKNLYQATWSYAFHSAAYFQLAQIECSRGNYELALESLDRSLTTNANNNKALNLKSAVLRKLDNPSQALKVSTEMMEYDRLDFGARFENYLTLKKLGREQESVKVLSELKTKLRGYVESYLELSLEYANAGLLDEAIDVLSNPGLTPENNGSNSPMISYYLGYFYSKKGDATKALDYFRRASEMSSDYCFPFRLEEIAILESAMKTNPTDAKAPFYLGNLLYDFQPENAIKQWENSANIDNTFALVHRNLGYGYYKTNKDLPKSIASYEKAISLNNKDQRWFYELDLVYADARADLSKRLKLLQDNHSVLVNSNVVDGLSREVLLLVQLGKYDKALEICNSRSFPQREGVDKMYGSYLNAYLLRGYKNLKAGKYKEALKDGLTAMQYPTNMMVAREYRGGRECEVYYFVGVVYEKMGNHTKAMEYWNGGINLRQRDNISEIYFYKAMCLKNAGRYDEATKIFDGLINVGKAKIEREDVDFFEKFGERQTPDERRADGHYLLGLGYLGKDMQKEAKQEFSEAVRLNVNHIWANKYLAD
jgi:tetratricopeptide (TPR) repeat protein